ncbi:hypothetical protein PAXRUDRAFT_834968 [Paxillus rubicundulus Ve08.2h10]|uniref:Uncharacterized protein n=1 Tax=Paxillus rubicundulus Ve08.2h10 TaxID=930991 RepID=A0A0D0CQ75_9AGAM|nr:hypothetical protein PAXRUDRAFT_834968 [Paxillus rubicundulus Ve08.2h10]
MDLSLRSRPNISKMNPSPQMWIQCVKSGPNESKFNPTSQKWTQHFGPARNGHHSPALEMVYSNLPANFQLHLCISRCPPLQF